MNADQTILHIVAALLRHSDQILLVHEQGPDDPEAVWALPGGVVENGECLTEALVREVREETGLQVLDPGHLIYVAQMDDRTERRVHTDEIPQPGYQATTFAFEIRAWYGELRAADPNAFVLEARFFPLDDALGKLDALPIRVMREPISAYLRGAASPGAVWFYRRERDASEVLIARVE